MADLPLYIGLISGTSMDGIDAALVALGERRCEVRHALAMPYPDDLQRELLAASRNPAACGLDTLGRLDHEVGAAFRDAALAVIEHGGVSAEDVVAIGSHGQTLRHQPRAGRPYTLQIGDPSLIAAGTGIATVADFRRGDLAAGGEGAPLAPAFHQWLFGDDERDRVVLNVGGFANITVLPARGGPVTGFDTGPGNTLMDAWCRNRRGEPYDEDGRWAASGTVDADLLAGMLADPYFALPPPKSTGFEYFDDAWLAAQLADAGRELADADVQATLCELTAASVADAIRDSAPGTRDVLICGGGAHNGFLGRRLAARLAPATLASTAAQGVDPGYIEAAAFAWLAARRLADAPGNLPGVTGARGPVVLGGVYSGSRRR